MRAIRRYFLAPLVVAAAALCAGPAAHFAAAASVAHPIVNKIVPNDCPAGTNWDDGTQSCV
jgi:hypothetical protein